MLVITMTTVGFGDLTPKSFLGRGIVGVTSIVGIFLLALFISLSSELLMLDRRQKRMISYVKQQGVKFAVFLIIRRSLQPLPSVFSDRSNNEFVLN